jgi:hypothetical protein
VGVTGHRPERLNPDELDSLQASVAATLKRIAGAFCKISGSTAAGEAYDLNETPALRLLSPLAEGADRIAAKCALAEGYALQCPLPFSVTDYRKDFEASDKHPDDTRAEFDDLLTQAERVLELDGSRQRSSRAYFRVGMFLLRHTDLLLALWDGNADDASVGTAGIVSEAQRQSMPTLWIDSTAPHLVKLRDTALTQGRWQALDEDLLSKLLERLLLPPVAERSENHGLCAWLSERIQPRQNTRLAYQTHGEPRRNPLTWVYRAFFALLGKRSLHWIGNRYWRDASSQWDALTNAASQLPNNTAELNRRVYAHYLWADSLASYYADQYRGTFILSFSLGCLAVLFALLSEPFTMFPKRFAVFTVAELVTILAIASLVLHGKKRDLHQRWLDFRLLAERLRHRAFLLPIGGVSRLALPYYERHSDFSYTWIHWLVRAVSRAEGIPTGSFKNTDYRQTYARYLTAMLKNQAGYHKTNAERHERIVSLLHGLNTVLLLLIVGACLTNVNQSYAKPDDALAVWSTISAAVLPAFGATVAGLLSQGEFERIAQRSAGMSERLAHIIDSLNKPDSSDAMETLEEAANEAIDIMSEELSDWQVIFHAKPLEMHA